MTTSELLSRLQQQGIRLWEENDGLRYSAPTGTMTAELRSAIRQRKSEIIEALQAGTGSAKGLSRIPSIPVASHYALSNAQQRLWILSQMDAGSSAYNIPLHLQLEGELDSGFLERAIQQVVDRHESLRTTFTTVDGEPGQIVGDPGRHRLPVVDIADRQDPADEARAMALAESSHVFDLQAGPLFRTRLVRMGPLRHVLLCTMHHIISDGISIGILFRELASAYNAQKRGVPSPAAELPIQYRDYAAWQRQQLASSAAAVHRDYWRQRLGGELPVLDLPTDAARPPTQTFKGKEILFSLGADRSAGLRQLTREHQASLYMVLLTALKVLLYRYTGAQDMVVGSPVAGRPHPDLQDQIGLYLNTLPIRTFPRGSLPFIDFLAQVRRACLEAFEHQEYPFDRLVDDLNVERDLSRSPVFDVMMILQNQDDAAPTFEGVRSSLLADHTGTSKVDITLCCKDMGDEIWVNLEYNTDLFCADRMQRMAGHFARLIDSILAEPVRPISQLDYLTASEEEALLHTWNATRMDYPRERTIVDLIDESAHSFRDQVAVVAEDRSLTYGQLEEESNRLAHYLVECEVRTGDFVGLCIDRNADMMVALLAILKAGAAYVPLDPHYPAARIHDILCDAGVTSLLTTAELWATLERDGKTEGFGLILLDRERHAIRRLSAIRPAVHVEPTLACYAIYTSGSTGQPKGVVIPHRALVNFLWSMARAPGLCAADVLLAVTTISFDIAALELFLPLVKGARIVLASQLAATDAAELRALFESADITAMQATPSTWRMLLDAGWRGSPGLKILCGGEALPGKLADRLLGRGGELWNMYGPTETTIWSTMYRVDEEQAVAAADEDVVPIGRPIANTEIYILDRDLRPVPVGVPGDLYIGGDGLAHSYHGRAELTAEKFIRHPFSATAGDRLYQTGDVARYRPDGNIEFLRRSDHQVKIRGFRIETGEVEAVLTTHPGIRQAAVVATGDESGARHLVAYLVGEAVPPRELRDWARRRLPDYMLPSLFLHLDSLPLTSNQKVDRKALPKPDIDAAARSAVYVPPADEIEKAITRVWQEILGATRIGSHDDFFELGGHSLKAIRFIAVLHRESGIALQLMDVFRNPTVESLAKVARARGRDLPKATQGTNHEALALPARDHDGILEITAEERALLED